MGVRNQKAIREICCLLLRLTALPLLAYRLRAKKRLTVILYHAVESWLFRRHLEFLRKRYTIISMGDYLDYRRNGGGLPDYPLVITFDDGHLENYNLLPVLRETGVPVTIFLCSNIVGTRRHFWFKERRRFRHLKNVPDKERLLRLRESGFGEDVEYDDYQALSAAMVDELKEVVDFQSHGMTHPVLPQCSGSKAQHEIFHSRRALKRDFSLDINGFAFPDGRYTRREIEFVREAGYDYAMTLDPGLNGKDADLFRLKRISVPDWAGIHYLCVKCSGVWHWIKKWK